jgi:hypothetical protein
MAEEINKINMGFLLNDLKVACAATDIIYKTLRQEKVDFMAIDMGELAETALNCILNAIKRLEKNQ